MGSFASRLKELRKSKGLSQEELAEKVGVKSGKQTISNWENEKTEPTLSDIRKVAEALETTLSYLIEGVEPAVAVGEPRAGYISVPMEEFIDLQRRVIKQMDEERDKAGNDK
ncbi:helix-turn-helix domain-containing protein [Spirosoma panaciterrae]|uniref:helix-turn-helix domain-containing protein n=1 Tax=Spirosoma panaciterrae TaxID=496058 RepID=UPI0003663737|nr:helix-turn-helix transcriptional regulator [Spirosoma panaciterrae]